MVDYYENRLYAINGTNNRILYSIPVSNPSGIAIDTFEYRDPRILFVTNRDNNTATIITPNIGGIDYIAPYQ